MLKHYFYAKNITQLYSTTSRQILFKTKINTMLKPYDALFWDSNLQHFFYVG